MLAYRIPRFKHYAALETRPIVSKLVLRNLVTIDTRFITSSSQSCSTKPLCTGSRRIFALKVLFDAALMAHRRLCCAASCFSASLSTVTTSRSSRTVTPSSASFSTTATCSYGVVVITGSSPLVSFPQLLTGLRGAVRPLFGVKGLTTKSFGTMRHSATRVICTSSEAGAGRRFPQRFTT